MDRLDKLLQKYRSKGYDFDKVIEVKSGKEATVYSVRDGGNVYAMKVYKDLKSRSFQATNKYVAGKFHRNKSARRAISKKNKFAKRYLHKAWVRREYYLLGKLQDLGANTPKVYEYTDNSILMEFIGDETRSAPRLIDVELSEKQAKKSLETILRNIELFLKAGIVHSDLSFYNILWWQNKPIIIDVPQAIDIRNNPNKDKLLKRDIDNVISSFRKYTQPDTNKVYKRFNIL